MCKQGNQLLVLHQACNSHRPCTHNLHVCYVSRMGHNHGLCTMMLPYIKFLVLAACQIQHVKSPFRWAENGAGGSLTLGADGREFGCRWSLSFLYQGERLEPGDITQKGPFPSVGNEYQASRNIKSIFDNVHPAIPSSKSFGYTQSSVSSSHLSFKITQNIPPKIFFIG